MAHSVLMRLIKLALTKGLNKKNVDANFIEELLGELYIKSKSEKTDERILKFAAKNNFMITIPESIQLK